MILSELTKYSMTQSIVRSLRNSCASCFWLLTVPQYFWCATSMWQTETSAYVAHQQTKMYQMVCTSLSVLLCAAALRTRQLAAIFHKVPSTKSSWSPVRLVQHYRPLRST